MDAYKFIFTIEVGYLPVQGRQFTLSQGLDVPISGQPEQCIYDAPKVNRVAVIGRDYIGMKPTMNVAEGDKVKIGQPLFSDKKNPGVIFTSPGAGTVSKINRGAKRVLQSVVIELDGSDDSVTYEAHAADQLSSLDPQNVKERLIESGLWVGFRTRPFSKIPAIDAVPADIFVTAIDTRPLAADAKVILDEYADDFKNGLEVLAHLTGGKVHVAHAPSTTIEVSDNPKIACSSFSGAHPAGLPGTHIHFLSPVGVSRSVWHINYQEVIAIGKLFTTGQHWLERVVSLAGPMVEKPRLLRTRLGANSDDLVDGQLKSGDVRVVAGSVLGGRRASGWSAYVGRYHYQISVLQEGEPRQLLHWVNPTLNKFSSLNVFTNKMFGSLANAIPMSTTRNGSCRAMVPIGNYERVVPLDMLPTPLLRSLLVRDTEEAQKLGCLELDEEDLALCTFVCHGKYEYGRALRESLEQIEKEG